MARNKFYLTFLAEYYAISACIH